VETWRALNEEGMVGGRLEKECDLGKMMDRC
jgi:hypothetical protein